MTDLERIGVPLASLLQNRVLAVLAVLLFVPWSLATQANPDADRIEKLYVDYRKAVETSSIDGYVAVLHPEVRLMPPGTPVIDGAEHYASFLEPVFATAVYRIDVLSYPEIEVVGDMATAQYEYVVHLTLKDPEVGVDQRGALTEQRTRSRYLDVLRRKDDGQWAIWRHSWTVLDDQPPAP